MGIGTHLLKHYGYAKIGDPCIRNKKKFLKRSLTTTASLSEKGFEMVQFLKAKGQTNETFEQYFGELTSHLSTKYPDKKIFYQMDGLLSH